MVLGHGLSLSPVWDASLEVREVEAVRDDVTQRSEVRLVTHGHVADSRGRDTC